MGTEEDPDLTAKLLEIAIRASATHSGASGQFVSELGIIDVVQQLKAEHPKLGKELVHKQHSDEWRQGYYKACEVVAVLGNLADLLRCEFDDDDEFPDDEFRVEDWTSELTTVAQRLVSVASKNDEHSDTSEKSQEHSDTSEKSQHAVQT